MLLNSLDLVGVVSGLCIRCIDGIGPMLRYINFRDKLEKKLYDLSLRNFEYLAAILYGRMGYKVTITFATRDGGKDVIAETYDYKRHEKEFVCAMRLSTLFYVFMVYKILFIGSPRR